MGEDRSDNCCLNAKLFQCNDSLEQDRNKNLESWKVEELNKGPNDLCMYVQMCKYYRMTKEQTLGLKKENRDALKRKKPSRY